jgi:hypothetical protein
MSLRINIFHLLESGKRNIAMNRWQFIYETTLVFSTSTIVFWGITALPTW